MLGNQLSHFRFEIPENGNGHFKGNVQGFTTENC